MSIKSAIFMCVPRVDPFANPQPAYLQVAESVAASIEAGEFTWRLPGERELAREYGVACMTARHGLEVPAGQPLTGRRRARPGGRASPPVLTEGVRHQPRRYRQPSTETPQAHPY